MHGARGRGARGTMRERRVAFARAYTAQLSAREAMPRRAATTVAAPPTQPVETATAVMMIEPMTMTPAISMLVDLCTDMTREQQADVLWYALTVSRGDGPGADGD
jgi:hypothetical protein